MYFRKILEKNFEITRSTASKVVNLMVEKGMVERQSVTMGRTSEKTCSDR